MQRADTEQIDPQRVKMKLTTQTLPSKSFSEKGLPVWSTSEKAGNWRNTGGGGGSLRRNGRMAVIEITPITKYQRKGFLYQGFLGDSAGIDGPPEAFDGDREAVLPQIRASI